MALLWWMMVLFGISLTIVFLIPLVIVLRNMNLLDEPTTRLVINACFISVISGFLLSFLGLLNLLLPLSMTMDMPSASEPSPLPTPTLPQTTPHPTPSSESLQPQSFCVYLLYAIIVFIITQRITSLFQSMDQFCAVVLTRKHHPFMDLWAPRMVKMSRVVVYAAGLCGIASSFGLRWKEIASVADSLGGSDRKVDEENRPMQNISQMEGDSSGVTKIRGELMLPTCGWQHASGFLLVTSDLMSYLLSLSAIALTAFIAFYGVREHRRTLQRGVYDLDSRVFQRLSAFKRLCGVTVASAVLDFLLVSLGISSRVHLQHELTSSLLLLRLLPPLMETGWTVLNREPLMEAIKVGCRCRCKPTPAMYLQSVEAITRPVAQEAWVERELNSTRRY